MGRYHSLGFQWPQLWFRGAPRLLFAHRACFACPLRVPLASPSQAPISQTLDSPFYPCLQASVLLSPASVPSRHHPGFWGP